MSHVTTFETGALASVVSLIASLTVLPNPLIASASSASAVACVGLRHVHSRREEIERLTKTLETTRTTLAQAELASAESETQISQLSTTVTNLGETIQAYRIDREDTAREMTDLRMTLDDTQAFAVQMQGERDRLIHEVERYSAQFDAQLTELTRLESEVARLTVELATHAQHKDLLVYQQTAETESKLREASEALTALRSRSVEMVDDIQSYATAVEGLETSLSYLGGEGYNSITTAHNEAVSSLVGEVKRLSTELTDALAPKLFGVPGEYSRADALIELLWANGFGVDANELTPASDGAFTVALNVRERTKLCAAYVEEMTKLGDHLATQVRALEPLRFELDRLNPFRVTCQVRYAAKAKATAKTLPWRGVEQFTVLAGKWQRVRITGGSEAGKSPTMELIAGAMQLARPETLALLAFPLSDSTKDNWTMRVTHSSLTACAREALDAKRSGFTVALLDECDTALEVESDLAATVKELLKTGSHRKVGCILSGQNANVRQWRGFDRSDFENCVNVHLGGTAYHAITNSNGLTPSEQDRLKADADKLTRYCEEANAAIDDPALMQRFALVVEPGKRPYFVQLPPFNSLPFRYSAEAESPTAPPSQHPTRCPKCGDERRVKNGKSQDGAQRYKCRQCGHTYTPDN
jgi:hypothetical protein